MDETQLIYHLVEARAWGAEGSSEHYRPPSLEREGFIHCSLRHQVGPTWSRIFGGAGGLIVLTIDPRRLESELRYEPGEPGEDFPHVYGPISVRAVIEATPIEDFDSRA